MATRTCGVLTEQGEPCTHRVAGRRKYCPDHPGGRSKYRPASGRTCAGYTQAGEPCSRTVAGRRTYCSDHRDGRTRSPRKAAGRTFTGPTTARAPARTQPWASDAPRATHAQRRTRRERVVRRAGKTEARLGVQWQDLVVEQAANYASTSGPLELTAADCSAIAQAVSSILLEGRRPRQRSEGWGFLWEMFGGPTGIEDLAASTSTSLKGVSEDPDLAAARALQALGVAMCRSAGIPLTDCPCFELSATWELEDVLFLVLRLALGDWSGLAIPFTPLTAA
jgi:hypothetical protein